MQFPSSLVLGLGLIAGIQAHPAEEREVAVTHLTFHGGPASYELFVPTNGAVIATNNDISIDTIVVDTSGYDALSLCAFNTPGPKALVGSVTPAGLKKITVGPPQPILSVSCRA
ncbi:hypothetical protein F4802DRAFT_549343, partial [Xylaria palmicola]